VPDADRASRLSALGAGCMLTGALGYYPRLTLAPGQRFASKRGYIVRFSDLQGPRVAALGAWITL
jgi:hypothetical protein